MNQLKSITISPLDSISEPVYPYSRGVILPSRKRRILAEYFDECENNSRCCTTCSGESDSSICGCSKAEGVYSRRISCSGEHSLSLLFRSPNRIGTFPINKVMFRQQLTGSGILSVGKDLYHEGIHYLYGFHFILNV